MLKTKYLLFAMASLLISHRMYSQDMLMSKAEPDNPLNIENHTIHVDVSSLDAGDCLSDYAFEGTAENVVANPSRELDPALDKILMQLKNNNQIIRIVHVGDSHVRGHIFPGVVKEKLEALLGSEAVERKYKAFDYNADGISTETGKSGVVYQVLGINGATAQKFSDSRYITMIRDLSPDLLIISFGTNEGSGRSYSRIQHKNQLDQFIRMMLKECPDVPLILTTPPGAYKRRNGQYRPNTNIGQVASTIREYADEKGYACWDLYNIVGGDSHACTNWYSNGLMQRDRIHFNNAGYELMGCLFYSAIINLIKDYAGHRL